MLLSTLMKKKSNYSTTMIMKLQRKKYNCLNMKKSTITIYSKTRVKRQTKQTMNRKKAIQKEKQESREIAKESKSIS